MEETGAVEALGAVDEAKTGSGEEVAGTGKLGLSAGWGYLDLRGPGGA